MLGLSRSSKFLLAISSVSFVIWIQTLGRLTRLQDPSLWLSVSDETLTAMSTLPHDCATTASSTSLTSRALSTPDLPQVLTIYFPQFHPDPLNDRLWGANFTDWDSLRAAPKQNKLGIPIPRPEDGRYYDLRDTAVRQKQGELARKYGVDGFIMHHYWFYDPQHRGPNLHAPLMQMLKDGQPNIPFLFNWCASTWTSQWTAPKQQQQQQPQSKKTEVLQAQYWNYTTDDVREHFLWLRQFWMLPNYIRIKNQPVFMIYQHFPQMKGLLQLFRTWASDDPELGNGLVIWMSRSTTHADLYDISQLDDNAQRVWKRRAQQAELLPSPASRHDGYVWNATVDYPYPHPWVTKALQLPAWCLNSDMMNNEDNLFLGTQPEIPGVVTTFDNTPRRQAKDATLFNVFKDPATAIARFRDSLYAAVYYQTCCRRHRKRLLRSQDVSHFVIINAWNEWAEAMIMEPSDVYGTGFLQAVQDVKAQIVEQGCTATE